MLTRLPLPLYTLSMLPIGFLLVDGGQVSSPRVAIPYHPIPAMPPRLCLAVGRDHAIQCHDTPAMPLHLCLAYGRDYALQIVPADGRSSPCCPRPCPICCPVGAPGMDSPSCRYAPVKIIDSTHG
jgi:hypothetical protein